MFHANNQVLIHKDCYIFKAGVLRLENAISIFYFLYSCHENQFEGERFLFLKKILGSSLNTERLKELYGNECQKKIRCFRI